eukprot:s2533_g8.t1
MLLVQWRTSGNLVVSLDEKQLSQTQTVGDLKKYLHQLTGISRFRQSLTSSEDVTELLDEQLLHSPGVLMLLQKSFWSGESEAAYTDKVRLAIEKNRVEDVVAHLTQPQDPNLVRSGGCSALHDACIFNREEIAKLLLEADSDLNITTRVGLTPLHIAADRGHDGMVHLLIGASADVERSNSSGVSPLMSAVRKGHHRCAQFLVESRADVNTSDSQPTTPLHIAAETGNALIAEMLLKAGALANVARFDAAKPLQLASRKGQDQVFGSLLKFGAELDVVIEDGASWQLFVAAMSDGDNVEVVSRLLEARAVIDFRRTSPLHLASEKGLVGSVALLLAAAADADRQDWQGARPLRLAAKNGHREVLRLLLESRADVSTELREKYSEDVMQLIACANDEAELQRLQKQLGQVSALLESTEKKITPQFMERANPTAKEKILQKRDELKQQKASISTQLEELTGSARALQSGTLPCPTIPDSAMHRLTAAFSCVCSLGFHCSIVSPSRVHSCMAWLKLLLLSTSPLFAGGVRPGSLLKESQELPIPELSRATLNDYLDKNTFNLQGELLAEDCNASLGVVTVAKELDPAWSVSLGPLTFCDTGVSFSPKFEIAVEVAGCGAKIGIGDVRDGISVFASASASFQVFGKGSNWTHMLQNLRTNAHSLTDLSESFLASIDQAINTTEQVVGGETAEVVRLLDEDEDIKANITAADILKDHGNPSAMEVRMKASAGIGIGAKVCPGWKDADGFRNVGAGANLDLGVELSFDLVVGYREDPRPRMVRLVIGLCNFLFQITFPIPG